MNVLQHISVRNYRLIIGGLSFLAAGVIYLLLFAAPSRAWLDLNTRLALARGKLLRMEEAVHRREQIEAVCRKFEQRILATGTDAEELGFLLKELESLTRSRNIQIKSIRPLPSQWVGNYRKFLVSLEIEGRVQNVFELLHAIDTSPKILTVEFLKIQALRTGPNLLSANILISRTSAGTTGKQQLQ
jgi:hypothetical protein